MARPLRIEYPNLSRECEGEDLPRRSGPRVAPQTCSRASSSGLLAMSRVLPEHPGERSSPLATRSVVNHLPSPRETVEPTMSRGMRQLNGIYTQEFNRRHRRTGHVFQGRFKAVLVERRVPSPAGSLRCPEPGASEGCAQSAGLAMVELPRDGRPRGRALVSHI